MLAAVASATGCSAVKATAPGVGATGGKGGAVSLGGVAGQTGTGAQPGTGTGAQPGAGGQGTGYVPPDASSGDPDPDAASACAHLNIGILGKPGQNPSSNFQAWLQARGTSVQRVLTTTTDALTAATLQPFDVVLLDWLTRDYTADEAAIFAAWVSAGGGFASLTGYSDNPSQDWHANSLLAPLGLAYAGPSLWGPVTQYASHPITAGITSVTFTGGYGISDLGGTASTRTPIAFLPNSNNAVVGEVVQMGAGRGFLWGDEWIEFDSEWSSMPQIPQLWVQIFSWISPPNRCKLIEIG